LSADRPFILALDLGGTRFRLALVDQTGKLHRRFVALTHAEDGREQVLRRIKEAAREMTSSVGLETVQGMGIAAPGPIDPVSGVLLTPPNLPGWENTPLKSLFEEEFRFPVYVGNDANLAALGEHRYGAARGVDDFVYITISTGIGGGIISGGRLLLGAKGLAGEVGHMTIDLQGPQCSCGNTGCWEAMASGSAIARTAIERIKGGRESVITSLVGAELEKVTAETVEQAARSGDPLAQEVMAEAGTLIGVGLVNLIHIFNPRLIVIGGGVSKAGDLIFEPARRIIAQRAMPPFREVEIIPAALGDDAGLLGAAVLVLDNT